MRIQFRVDGGLAAFPGLARPVTIHGDSLPPAQGARLRELVRRARFFALPRHADAPTVSPDARAYTIAIDDGPQCRTVTVHEPIADPALRDLIAALREHVAVAGQRR